jgi:hypothetical protein
VRALATTTVSLTAPVGWAFENNGTHHTVWPNIPSDGFKCNIIINDMSLGGRVISQEQLAAYILSQFSDSPGFRLKDKWTGDRGGAFLIDFSFTMNDDFNGFYRVFTAMKDGKIYIINFVGTQKQYDILEACVDDLIESTKFR